MANIERTFFPSKIHVAQPTWQISKKVLIKIDLCAESETVDRRKLLSRELAKKQSSKNANGVRKQINTYYRP